MSRPPSVSRCPSSLSVAGGGALLILIAIVATSVAVAAKVDKKKRACYWELQTETYSEWVCRRVRR